MQCTHLVSVRWNFCYRLCSLLDLQQWKPQISNCNLKSTHIVSGRSIFLDQLRTHIGLKQRNIMEILYRLFNFLFVSTDTLLHISRGFYPRLYGNREICYNAEKEGRPVKMCIHICDQDGCNTGNRPVPSPWRACAVSVTTLIVLWLYRNYL